MQRIALLCVLTLTLNSAYNAALGQFQRELPQALVEQIDEHVTQAQNFEASDDYNQAAFQYNRAATIYWVNGFHDKAVDFFHKAIDMNKQIGNSNALIALYNNIGMIYTDQEDFDNAIDYFKRTLEASRSLGRRPDIASSLLNIASAELEAGLHTNAAATLEEANALARELNNERLIRNSYSLLADVYERLGDAEKSSEYFALYTAIARKMQRDELRQREGEARKKVNQAHSQVSQVEAQKKATEEELNVKLRTLKETEETLQQVEVMTRDQQMQIDLLSKERQLQNATIQNQRLMRNVYITIIVAFAGFVVLIIFNLRQKKKANRLLAAQNAEIAAQKDRIEKQNHRISEAFEKINKQNRDITSSINYAQRIQEALLPSEANLQTYIPDSFILLKPRDIVSGDFYWFLGYQSANNPEPIRSKSVVPLPGLDENDRGLLISAVDCTGHGVPGAFMSMIGFNLLETIARSGAVAPNLILNNLHTNIRYLLKQDTTDNRDGMDMAICKVRNNGRFVDYSGAKNPLFVVSNGEVKTIRATPFPIGGMQKEARREFVAHTIHVTEPTCFYIFSDGYTDQFGGEYDRKFGTKQFRELLLEIHSMPMPEQKAILVERIKEWMGKERNQIDDIIVIGFRLGDKPTSF